MVGVKTITFCLWYSVRELVAGLLLDSPFCVIFGLLNFPVP